MSKPYQHHDPIADQGKAEPHPKAPNGGKRRVPKYLIKRKAEGIFNAFKSKPTSAP